MEDTTPSSTNSTSRIIGKSLGLAIILCAVIICGVAIWVYINRPQTDDATIRANFIGVAPHASGHIVQLLVKDNQFVHEGDLLFTIDRRPYEHAVARAKASMLLISQSSSEQSFCFVIPTNRVNAVLASLREELKHELEREDVVCAVHRLKRQPAAVQRDLLQRCRRAV